MFALQNSLMAPDIAIMKRAPKDTANFSRGRSYTSVPTAPETSGVFDVTGVVPLTPFSLAMQSLRRSTSEPFGPADSTLSLFPVALVKSLRCPRSFPTMESAKFLFVKEGFPTSSGSSSVWAVLGGLRKKGVGFHDIELHL